MDIFQAIILSVVEGITEFLPISSTGHLILTSEVLSLPQTEFIKTFEIAIQSGAILSVLVLYGKKLIKEWGILKRVIWTAIPTGILGLILYKLIKQYLLGSSLITVISLLVGGILIIILERYFAKKPGNLKIEQLSLKNSLILGVVQTISVIPGVSRSASTIFGGMFLGLSRQAATELSFMVAIPIMLAATGLDLVQSAGNFTNDDIQILLIGTVGSFITALIAMKWLLSYIKTHNFIYFGIYRIVVALLFLFI